MGQSDTIPYPEVDLAWDNQSVLHAHTTGNTAESVTGTVAFSLGAVLELCGFDTWVAVGSTKALAQAHAAMYLAGVPFRVKLLPGSRTIWVDANTGGSVAIHQISPP